MYMHGWAEDLASVFSSGQQLVQAVRPPSPVGTTPLAPVYAPPVQQQRSMFSDPLTLSLIALAGVAVIILLMRR